MFQFGFNPADAMSIRNGDCLDCEDCKGVCREVFEAQYLPDVLLGREALAN